MGPINDIDVLAPAIAIAGFCILLGVLIGLGMPWMWAELIKPFLQWLVL